MAFGLDVVDLIYTDTSKVDMGTLDDYEVDLDLAVDKDFELRVGDYIMEPGAMWYVEDTEFGGVVDSFETDPQSYQIKYSGRGWRGILDTKILYSTDLTNTITVSGKLHAVINQFLETYDVADFFICDAAELDDDETVKDDISNFDLQPGITLYDTLVLLGNSLGLTYLFAYNNRDKMVHITPIIPDDYADYLAYCQDNSISFTIKKDSGVTNHLVCSGIDETGKRRTLHLFTDEGGTIQPYLKDGVESPVKDDDYILDLSKKQLSGIDEIVNYMDGDVSVQENYQLVTQASKPSDWDSSYNTKYFKKVINPQYGEEIIRQVPVKLQVGVGTWFYDGDFIVKQGDNTVSKTRTVKENGKNVSKNNYWLVSPTKVAIIDFDDDYLNLKVVINNTNYTVPVNGQLIINYGGNLSDLKITLAGTELDPEYDYSVEQKSRSKTVQFRSEYKNQKVSLYPVTDRSIDYEPLTATEKETYNLLGSAPAGWNATYSYFYTRSWNQETKTWDYSAATSETTTDMSRLTRITSKSAPGDWRTNYNQYYYKFQTGTGIELRAYAGVNVDKYVKMTAKPSDWDTEYKNYYRIRYVRTEKKKKKKVEKEYATKVKGSKKVYRAVPAAKKKVKQKGKWITKEVAPTFRKNVYYRKDSITNPPKYNKNNCYLPATKVVAPSFQKNKYFSKSTSIVKPTYKKSVYYVRLEDHYLNLALNGLQQLASLRASESQNVSVEDLDLNIGDTVGGQDEVTGVDISQAVTNKIIKITRGVVTTEYEIGGEG